MSVPEETKELFQLADDGCPHVEPMTAEEIVADPAVFVARNGEPKTYCLFVPFSPTILRHMIGKDYCVSIDPFKYGTQSGSLIETMCKEDYEALRSRFYPNHSPFGQMYEEKENCDGEEERADA